MTRYPRLAFALLTCSLCSCAAVDATDSAGTAEDREVASQPAALEAGDGDLEWSKFYEGAVDSIPMGVSADRGGNVYVAAPRFIAKYGPKGLTSWTFATGNSNRNVIAADGRGSVFITGERSDLMTLCSTSPQQASTFAVVKLTESGSCVFHRRYAFPSAFEGAEPRFRTMRADSAGNAILGGEVSVNGTRKIIVVKVSSSGALVFAKSFGAMRDAGTTAQPQGFGGLAIDGGSNIHFTGHFRQTIDFGAGTLSASSPSNDASDLTMGTVFVETLSPGGEHLRTVTFGSIASATGIASNASGRLAIIGRFSGTLDWGNRSAVNTGATHDGYVVALNPDGNSRWYRRFYGSASQDLDAVAFDDYGRVDVVGSFSSPRGAEATMTIAPTTHTTSGTTKPLFVARLDGTWGSTVWSRTYTHGDIGGESSTPGWFSGDALAVTSDYSRMVIAGRWSQEHPDNTDNDHGFLIRIKP